MKSTKFSPIEFGLYLKKLREKKGLSQWDVAHLLHYKSSQFVSNWERGLSTPPLKALLVLGKAYGVPSESLYKQLLKHINNQLNAEFERLRKTGSNN